MKSLFEVCARVGTGRQGKSNIPYCVVELLVPMGYRLCRKIGSQSSNTEVGDQRGACSRNETFPK